MRQKLKPFSLVLILSSILFSCTKDETPMVVPVTAITVNNLPADTVLGLNPITGMPISAGKYTFYSGARTRRNARKLPFDIFA